MSESDSATVDGSAAPSSAHGPGQDTQGEGLSKDMLANLFRELHSLRAEVQNNSTSAPVVSAQPPSEVLQKPGILAQWRHNEGIKANLVRIQAEVKKSDPDPQLVEDVAKASIEMVDDRLEYLHVAAIHNFQVADKYIGAGRNGVSEEKQRRISQAAAEVERENKRKFSERKRSYAEVAPSSTQQPFPQGWGSYRPSWPQPNPEGSTQFQGFQTPRFSRMQGNGYPGAYRGPTAIQTPPYAGYNPSGTGYCYICGETSHYSPSCPSNIRNIYRYGAGIKAITQFPNGKEIPGQPK